MTWLCEHHACRCARAAELAAMDRLLEAIAIHEQRVTCRLQRAPSDDPARQVDYSQMPAPCA